MEKRIATLEFDRDRKSMGVIVNSVSGGKLLLVKVCFFPFIPQMWLLKDFPHLGWMAEKRNHEESLPYFNHRLNHKDFDSFFNLVLNLPISSIENLAFYFLPKSFN